MLEFLSDIVNERSGKKNPKKDTNIFFYRSIFSILQTHNLYNLIPKNVSLEEIMGVVSLNLVLNEEIERK